MKYTPELLNASGLTSAVLQLGDTEYVYSLSDMETLEELRSILVNADPMMGASACPFDGRLVLDLSDGRSTCICLAVDSCSVYLADETYYDYRDKNEELFGFFGLTSYAIVDLLYK